jgi:hypothetical protein
VATCDIAALRAHALRNSDWMRQQRALASQAFASGRISDAKAIVIKLQYAPLAPLTRQRFPRLKAIFPCVSSLDDASFDWFLCMAGT